MRGIFGVHAPSNSIGPAACAVRRRRRTPRFQQETQKIQVLHPVSLRNQKAILSLPQLYRICTELSDHTVLGYFPLFIFDVICRKSEMLRLVRTSAITAFGRSRPAADATREVVERWLLHGCDVSVGHRRVSYDPFAKNDVGRTPTS